MTKTIKEIYEDYMNKNRPSIIPLTVDDSRIIPMMPTPIGIPELPKMPHVVFPDDMVPDMMDISKVLENYIDKKVKNKIPLKSTDYKFHVEGSFIKVNVTRKFKNECDKAIEATLTFPIPVNAVICDIDYECDGRKLHALSQKKQEASAKYEQAVVDGKSAVLYEELIRGIHMLSIGNIGADKEISISITYYIPISENGNVIIPMTASDIYGCSPFDDVSDIKSTSDIQKAFVSISKTAFKRGMTIQGLNNDSTVILNKPLVINVNNVDRSTMNGLMVCDDKCYGVDITPEKVVSKENLNLSILCDVSGSMSQKNQIGSLSFSKYEQMIAGLMDNLTNNVISHVDNVDLWEFSNKVKKLHGNNLLDALSHMSQPGGGTGIGLALETVIAESNSNSILLITDGKSYSLDVQKISELGKRISVVLVGEDALEAKVGYLASLTGGQLYFTTGTCGHIIRDALKFNRTSCRHRHISNHIEGEFQVNASGVTFDIKVKNMDNYKIIHKHNHIGSIAAGLLVPYVKKEIAEHLVVDNNIVSHLSSLVLVDEESEKQNGLPELVKVPLMKHHSASGGIATRSVKGITLQASGYSEAHNSSWDVFGCSPESLPQASVSNRAEDLGSTQNNVFIPYMQAVKNKDKWSEIANSLSWYANITLDTLPPEISNEVLKFIAINKNVMLYSVLRNISPIDAFLTALSTFVMKKMSGNGRYANRFYQKNTKGITDEMKKILDAIVHDMEQE